MICDVVRGSATACDGGALSVHRAEGSLRTGGLLPNPSRTSAPSGTVDVPLDSLGASRDVVPVVATAAASATDAPGLQLLVLVAIIRRANSPWHGLNAFTAALPPPSPSSSPPSPSLPPSPPPRPPPPPSPPPSPRRALIAATLTAAVAVATPAAATLSTALAAAALTALVVAAVATAAAAARLAAALVAALVSCARLGEGRAPNAPHLRAGRVS